MTVTRACTSGLQAVTLAAAAIERGEADVVIAGGSDSTSNAEVKLPQKLVHAAAPLMYGKATAGDVLGMLRQLAPLSDVLPRVPRIAERTTGKVMGEAAEEMAAPQRDLPRGAGRARRALAPPRRRGHRRGRFASEVVPVESRRQDGARRQHRARRHQRREAGQAASRRSPRTARSPPATPAR